MTSTTAQRRAPGAGAGARQDRLTSLLVWTAFVLVAAAAALAADIWQGIASAHSVERSVEAPATATREPLAARPAMPTQELTALPLPTAVPAPTFSAAITPPPCVPPQDWDIYLVQPGNTLYSLAQRFGTEVETLMWVNCLNTSTIFVDQRLYVPGPLPEATVPVPAPTASLLMTAAVDQSGSAAAGAEPAAPVSTPLSPPTVPGALRINMPERYLNIVLLGSDKRPRSGAWRTDSMIVVSIDGENSVVRLLSIPRDLWVFIPGHGYNRINTADLWGELTKKGTGPERVKQTIQYNLGIPIHYYVRVDFQGFMKIIDAVGGIDIDVDCPLPDIDLTAGVHHMNGAQALRYSRSRYSTNDFDRGRRQRKVLMSLWEQGLSLDLIPKLPSLWREMSDAYQTDLPLDQVINLAYIGARLKPQRILSRAIGPAQVQSWITPQGASVLLPVPERIKPLLENYYSGSDASALDSGEKVRVQVLNGSPRKQAEQLAAASLRWGGFKVVATALAEARNLAASQIVVYSGNVAAAEELADLLGLPRSSIRDAAGTAGPASPEGPVEIQVTLGQDYNPCGR